MAQPTTEILLEHELLRKGVDALRAEHSRCNSCRRTLLTGETGFVYDDGRIACALCRPLRREEPIDVMPVRGAAHGGAVRRAVPVAA